jgi:transcriptional regulator with XRE-family HTH domain
MLTTRERPNTLEGVTKGAGEAIKKRRTALGVTVKALAERAGVDRGRIAAIEDGASARSATIGAIEKALNELEDEMGGPYDAGEHGGRLVTFRLSGDFGVDLVVEGPVENLSELEGSVERLIQKMRTKGEPGR